MSKSEEAAVNQPENTTTQRNETVGRKDPAVKVGYWMAVLFPPIGILVGNALISRNSDKGPRIVVISVVSLIVWAVIIVTVDELSSGAIIRGSA